MNDDDAQDDLELEPDIEFGDVASAQAKIKQLRGELKEAQAKRDEYLTGWQRCKADSINARKELMHDAERRAKREKASLIEDIVPVLDSFDMATGSEAWGDVREAFRIGVENVRNQLLDVLSRHGVERFGRVGEQFDPRMHEAVQEIDGVAGEPHSIVKVMRHGYRGGDVVLRPAQVILKGA